MRSVSPNIALAVSGLWRQILRKLARRSDSVSRVPAVRRHDERIDLTTSARTTSIRHVDRRLNARLRLFDEGAPMLRRALERQGRDGLLPAGEEFYACPCCLEAHPREAAIAGWLSEEHVPPKGLESMIATSQPALRHSYATVDAAAPVPITTRSNFLNMDLSP